MGAEVAGVGMLVINVESLAEFVGAVDDNPVAGLICTSVEDVPVVALGASTLVLANPNVVVAMLIGTAVVMEAVLVLSAWLSGPVETMAGVDVWPETGICVLVL